MNKAMLMGRLTRDPELRTTQSQIAVATFTLAVDRRFKSQDGERQADFIPVVAWRGLAEFAGRYLNKGTKVVVVGTIQVRNYDDKEGRKVYITEVVADEIHFAESRRENAEDTSYTPRKDKPMDRIATDLNPSGDQDGFLTEDENTDLPFDV